jgi:hypothetical protein
MPDGRRHQRVGARAEGSDERASEAGKELLRTVGEHYAGQKPQVALHVRCDEARLDVYRAHVLIGWIDSPEGRHDFEP